MKEKKKLKINARLKGLLIIIASALSIIADFILMMIVYKSKNGNYRNPQIIAFLFLCLFLCLLWLFYGIVLLVMGDKTRANKTETQNENNETAITGKDERNKDDKA